MRYFLKTISILFLTSCSIIHPSEQEQAANPYEKADVFYLNEPGWSVFYLGSPTIDSNFDKRTRMSDDYCSRFSISDKDTLNYIYERITSASKEPSPSWKYTFPRIMLIMYDYDTFSADTLCTDTISYCALQFNSSKFNDSGLVMFLSEMVLRRSPLWRDELNFWLNPDTYTFLFIPEEYE